MFSDKINMENPQDFLVFYEILFCNKFNYFWKNHKKFQGVFFFTTFSNINKNLMIF